MIRNTTIAKEEQLVKQFQKLLRSGKDLSTQSMYEDTAKIFFLEWERVSHIVQRHYRKMITEEMIIFCKENSDQNFDEVLQGFCKRFKLCKREARFILGYRSLKDARLKVQA